MKDSMLLSRGLDRWITSSSRLLIDVWPRTGQASTVAFACSSLSTTAQVTTAKHEDATAYLASRKAAVSR